MGSPVPIVFFFITIPKIGLLYILLQVGFIFNCILNLFFGNLFVGIGCISLIIGFINALYQFQFFRFLAYSSIFNIGFLMIAFGSLVLYNFYILLYFLVPYISIIIGIFFIIIPLYGLKKEFVFYIGNFSVLMQSNFWLGCSFCLLIVALSGLPPFGIFFGKLFIFMGLLFSGSRILVLLFFFLSAFSSFYYFRLIRIVFFSNISEYVFINFNNCRYLISLFIIINSCFFMYYDFIYLFFFNIIDYAY